MKMFRKTPLALAIAALIASPMVAYAGGSSNGDGHRGSDLDVEIEKEWETEYEVEAERDFDTEKDVDIDLLVFGVSVPLADAYSQAYIESNQVNTSNNQGLVLVGTDENGNEMWAYPVNDIVDNDAVVSGSGLGASGNVGINVAGGDNNQQANDAALALVDANFVFAMSEVGSLQTNTNQLVANYKVNNQARVVDSVNNVSGNLGLNVAAGNNNQQHNALAASVNTSFGNVAEADVFGMQHSEGNNTANIGQRQRVDVENVSVSVSGTVSGPTSASGSGSYSGDWQQTNNVYPELWLSNAFASPNPPANSVDHPCSNCHQAGHLDFDNEQENGQFAGTESGSLSYTEVGSASLSGTFTGNLALISVFDEVPHHNNARLSNSLNGASGNIGVNVAAGTGNQQRNSLSIAAATGGTPSTPSE